MVKIEDSLNTQEIVLKAFLDIEDSFDDSHKETIIGTVTSQRIENPTNSSRYS